MEPKIAVNPNGATAQMMSEANKVYEVIDSAARVITLRKPPFFAQFEMIKALGADAQNGAYVQMVMPIIFVSMIDGQVTPQPSNAAQIKAFIQRLDEHGYEAVSKGIQEHFVVDPQASVDKEALKN